MTGGMPDGEARSDGGAGVLLSRAFRVLGAFEAEQPEMSLAELARAVDLPKSTVHRLAQQLVAEGALERCGMGYRLGLRMFEIGSIIGPQRRLREMAVPYMQDLYEATHETVQLGILDYLEVVYIEKIESHRSVKLPTFVGARMPAHCTALGKVLLAFRDREVLDLLLTCDMANRTPYTITVPSVLVTELNDVARAGLAFDREESVVGVGCVAAPVFDWKGRSIAALSVSGPLSRFNPDAIANRLGHAANAITKLMRGRVPEALVR